MSCTRVANVTFRYGCMRTRPLAGAVTPTLGCQRRGGRTRRGPRRCSIDHGRLAINLGNPALGNGYRSSETRTLTPCKSQDMRAIRAGDRWRSRPAAERRPPPGPRMESAPPILGMNPASRHRRSVSRLPSSVTQEGAVVPPAPNAFDASPGPRVACSLARLCAIRVMTRGFQAAETAAKD